jgi:hypothetical protein
MSDTISPLLPDPAIQALADQVSDLAAEIHMLRESITTAAEWDNQARMDRQRVLDRTLAEVRRWLRLLVGVLAVLAVLAIWLLVHAGI